MSKPPLVKNAANEEEVRRAAEIEKRGRQREQDDLRNVLSSKSGRRFVWGLLKFCGVYQSSARFHSGSETYFEEGKRNVGLKILADLNDANPEVYVTMMNESKRGDYDHG